jgi:hypothetical protein
MNTRVRLNTTDTLLDGNFRITTATRINPEPAPATSSGDFGVRCVGNSGTLSKLTPIDVDGMCRGYDIGVKKGWLTPAEAAELKAQARRYSSGASEVQTNAVGISTVQWSTSEGRKVEEISALSQSDVDDLERLFGGGVLTQDQLAAIRSANKGKPKAARTGMAATDRALRSVADNGRRAAQGQKFAAACKELWG